MPNLSGLPALDAAIGLAFIYFVFSLVASGINEAIASVFGLRARVLEEALRKMLTSSDTPVEQANKLVGALAAHPLIEGLVKNPKKSWWQPWRQSFPSYLPSRTFALTSSWCWSSDSSTPSSTTRN